MGGGEMTVKRLATLFKAGSWRRNGAVHPPGALREDDGGRESPPAVPLGLGTTSYGLTGSTGTSRKGAQQPAETRQA
eukprot:scaffold173884_cov36-Prasinocladus_malaysianus.AAC.2